MTNPVEILQKARKHKGFTQEALAAELGITHRMIQRYEEGQWPKYKSKNIVAIDKLLGTNLNEIIYDKKVPRETPDDVKEKYLALLEKVARQDLHAIEERLSSIESVISQNQKLLTILAGEDPNEADVPGLSDKKQDTRTYKKGIPDGKGKSSN